LEQKAARYGLGADPNLDIEIEEIKEEIEQLEQEIKKAFDKI